MPQAPHSKRFWSIALLLAAVVVVGGGLVLWNKVLKERIYPKRFGAVAEGVIYRSGQIHGSLIGPTLEKYHIQTIVDLTGEDADEADNQAEVIAADKLGVDHVRLSMKGNGIGSVDKYATAIALLDEAANEKRPTLVHCAAGSQRTGGVVAGYRLLIEHEDPADVLAEMQQYDWDPRGDAVLVEFLDENLPAIAAALVERGVIPKVPDPMPRLGD